LQSDGTTHGSISAALAAANAAIPSPLASSVRFPAEDGGRSLADMAQRDLDAALQLLADRAQYITGANGAAIALRRGGKNDLLCRASIGPNAPELGALLSTEFGLSGESIRTRKALRCDDAERDARVNREVCHQLGIASVVVMPVVHDDEVLGVFELFSGKAHAFGERDLSALERLSEMVETAVRLARAAEQVPEPVMPVVPSGQVQPVAKAAAAAGLPAAPKPPMPKKLLLWSAPVHAGTKVPSVVESDTTSVPPVLRSLRKCEACGFPISAGRALCVECEEKKWRGQLKRPQTFPFPSIPAATPKAAQSPASTQARAALRTVATASSTTVLSDVHESKAVTATAVLVESVSTNPSEPAPKVLQNAALHPAVLKDATNLSSQTFTLTAGLEPHQSWLSTNKYILGAILVIAATVAAILFLR
jgi:hypothetical protein